MPGTVSVLMVWEKTPPCTASIVNRAATIVSLPNHHHSLKHYHKSSGRTSSENQDLPKRDRDPQGKVSTNLQNTERERVAIVECSDRREDKRRGSGFLLIKYRWNALPAEQRDGMKNYISEVIVQLSSNEASFRRGRLYVNKLIVILVQFTKYKFTLSLQNMKLSAPLATGLILVSCFPGGQASNVATYISKGIVALSVLMTT
ncbi:hypothetical protein Syun_020635 [Stephania yunnanensis]|uniref:Uncharacterized protein n=1 Tax=Stephania yunnanensis TaxID=152371 RepID=A0AAP0IEZ3_9MAGN